MSLLLSLCFRYTLLTPPCFSTTVSLTTLLSVCVCDSFQQIHFITLPLSVFVVSTLHIIILFHAVRHHFSSTSLSFLLFLQFLCFLTTYTSLSVYLYISVLLFLHYLTDSNTSCFSCSHSLFPTVSHFAQSHSLSHCMRVTTLPCLCVQ